MTTYLATLMIAGTDPTEITDEFRTDTFCSPACRFSFFGLNDTAAMREMTAPYFRDDEGYEFHERCRYCDVLIVASWILEASPVFDIEAIRIAAAATTTVKSPTWSSVRRGAGYKFLGRSRVA